MSYFKRWASGITARLDWLVGQIENHEALVESAVADMRAKTARAKARLERVRRDGRELRERLATEQAAIESWRERARTCEEEQRALECLRRSHRAQALAQTLATRLTEHERVEAQLAKEVRALEERVGEIKQSYHVMRARQTRAEALASLQQATSGTDIESLMERWEGKLAESELGSDLGSSESDIFDREFSCAEEKASLAAELAALRGSHD